MDGAELSYKVDKFVDASPRTSTESLADAVAVVSKSADDASAV